MSMKAIKELRDWARAELDDYEESVALEAACEIEHEVEEMFLRLPLDKNGLPIRPYENGLKLEDGTIAPKEHVYGVNGETVYIWQHGENIATGIYGHIASMLEIVENDPVKELLMRYAEEWAVNGVEWDVNQNLEIVDEYAEKMRGALQ